jgi:solute carrier family 13 (sodium-dependent dicarboxylate transporter), member 2/3/5
VLMLPIAVSIITVVIGQLARDGAQADEGDEPAEAPELASAAPVFATCLMLAVAYSASIGSIGTLIGTPPNLFMRGFLESTYGIEIGFGQWMLVGVPLSITFLILAWMVLTFFLYRPEVEEIPGGDALVERELASLGPMSRGEKIVLVVFLLTATAWILRDPVTDWAWLVSQLPWVASVTDTTIAIAAALKASGVTTELYLVEGVGHMGAFISQSARTEALKFLDRMLKI